MRGEQRRAHAVRVVAAPEHGLRCDGRRARRLALAARCGGREREHERRGERGQAPGAERVTSARPYWGGDPIWCEFVTFARPACLKQETNSI